MSTVLKFRRGNTAAANAFIGQEGELFVDTTKDTLVVHDGVTAGGVPLATESYVTTQISNLIDSAPTALNTLNELAAALNDDANFASTVTTSLAGKQDSLVSGTNIKTINGNSLLGSGDITISGGGSSFSGSYNDLTDKPTIPTATSQLTNDSDFITTTTLSSVAFTGSYNSLFDKPTLVSNFTNDAAYATENYIINLQLATESYVNNSLTSKQDSLVSGTNIKTINGNSIVGSGNITLFSGSYNDLTDKPIVNSTVTTTTTAQQELDSYSATAYRTSKYIVQAVSSSGIHSTEVLLTHDGSTVYISEYATIYTSSLLFTLDADILSGNVRLLVTPTIADVIFDVNRTSLAIGGATSGGSSSQGDMMALSGTEDLQSGSGTEDLNV